MLCSKCFKKIKDGEEVQIKCSIICEKCASNSMGKKGCWKFWKVNKMSTVLWGMIGDS
jgi:hypothetical protein